NENGRYPTTDEWNSGSITSSTTGEIFMYNIPTAPSPADGDCLSASNTYSYIPQNSGASYTIEFCTGKQISDLLAGAKCLTPGGITNCGESAPPPPSWACGDNLDYQGDAYATIQIGAQCWFAENLKTTKYNDNTNISNITDNTAWQNDTTGAYTWCDNNIVNKDTYGALYNFHSVNTGKLCPSDWHVPSNDEWTILERAVCTSGTCESDFPYGSTTTGWRGTDEGAKLAGELGLWTDGTLRSHASFGNSGFNILPAGRRLPDGTFFGFGDLSYFYSSSTYGAMGSWRRGVLHYNETKVNRYYEIVRTNGFSVRCLKD
ncbi:hypothetical protein CVU82_04455, partial [Candidatus Falkowbacteria bacterium HGW-Falkowbacteria-1]